MTDERILPYISLGDDPDIKGIYSNIIQDYAQYFPYVRMFISYYRHNRSISEENDPEQPDSITQLTHPSDCPEPATLKQDELTDLWPP